jgi:hypothetical protein
LTVNKRTDVVYAVRRADNMLELIEDRARSEAKSRVLGAKRPMALEDQAVDRVDEAVEAETRRLVR